MGFSRRKKYCDVCSIGRIRGLVNLRSEPSTPYSARGGKVFFPQKQGNARTPQKVVEQADRIAQMDVEHMGLMS